MIKVTCDMCKKPIDFNVDGVNVQFHSYGVVNFKTYYDDEKQLCVACAAKASKWIDDQCKAYVEEIVNDAKDLQEEKVVKKVEL